MLNESEVEILLVEDNPNDAEIAMRALKKHNFGNKVFHVSDGEEALDFIYYRGKFAERNKENKPKVILLDIKLPKINGLEVLKILKDDPVSRIIPVVILTSSNEETDMMKSYQLGANSYLVKPVDFEKFAISIKDIGFYWLLLNKLPERSR